MLERHYRFGLTSSQSGTQHRLAGLATKGESRLVGRRAPERDMPLLVQ